MDRAGREQLRVVLHEVATWIQQAGASNAAHHSIVQGATAAYDELVRRRVDVGDPGEPAWQVICLGLPDESRLGQIACEAQTRLSPQDHAQLEYLLSDVSRAARDASMLTRAGRIFASKKRRAIGERGAQFILNYYASAQTVGVPQLLGQRSAAALAKAAPAQVPTADALADWVGFGARLAEVAPLAALVPAEPVSDLPRAIAWMQRAAEELPKLRKAAVDAGTKIRHSQVRRLLIEMPVDRLRDATRDRIRTAPLTDAGIKTVQAVIDRERAILQLPGIGPTSATRISAAARHLQQITYEEMPVRIDIQARSQETTDLLAALRAWDRVRRCIAADDEAIVEEVRALATAMNTSVSRLLVLSATPSIDAFSAVLERARSRGLAASQALTATDEVDPWTDFLNRPADYFAMLAELGFIVEDEQKIHGDLPDEIIEAVRALELKTEHLKASLRGYQSFAARFALVQRRVIIGDEMGLGKTVEALAVFAHLRSMGDQWFLVVCPAAVVTNWVREIRHKTSLLGHRLHGLDRPAALRNWKRSGGVAVTTFDTLGWLEGQERPTEDIGCVVVDEAHYIKRPGTLRSQRTARLLEGCDRAVFLTGTPLENRVDEFRQLVSYLRPDLVVDDDEYAPRRFRKQVAPAYLRRNQEDVLNELPELVEVDEWLPMSAEDQAAYREAVADGDFMAMRQAAMLQGAASEKLQRLVEIVNEAADNGRKIIVFSYFRDVLDQVVRAFEGAVFGPITGSVPAPRRQQLVDDFSNAPDSALLVSQIMAGGVGLNIQAASVVVICEPQLKPTTEWQAIARARRMGQLYTVQVHRLLSDEGADARIREILARKKALFDGFARESDTAQSAPEAFDISEAELAREVLAAERERLFASGQRADHSMTLEQDALP